MHVVKGAQIWQFKEQLGETRDITRSTLADQRTEGFNQTVLEHLHRLYIFYSRAIWKMSENKLIKHIHN